MEEVNGLVRWLEEVLVFGQREEDLQGFFLVEMLCKNFRVGVELEVEVDQEVLDVGVLQREGGD